MKGHIRERSPGHWAIVIDQPDPTTGERRRKPGRKILSADMAFPKRSGSASGPRPLHGPIP